MFSTELAARLRVATIERTRHERMTNDIQIWSEGTDNLSLRVETNAISRTYVVSLGVKLL